jgi:hypothetical protein
MHAALHAAGKKRRPASEQLPSHRLSGVEGARREAAIRRKHPRGRRRLSAPAAARQAPGGEHAGGAAPPADVVPAPVQRVTAAETGT